MLFSRDESARYVPYGSFFEIPLFTCYQAQLTLAACYVTWLSVSFLIRYAKVPARMKETYRLLTTDWHIRYVKLRNGRKYFHNPYYFDKRPACIKHIQIFHTHLRSSYDKTNRFCPGDWGIAFWQGFLAFKQTDRKAMRVHFKSMHTMYMHTILCWLRKLP